MPAIQIARLRLQTAQLLDTFDQPGAFVHALHGLLEYYADRTHRPGQAGAPPPLIRPYNVPRPVLRQIETEMANAASADPGAAQTLADALWAEPFLECRLLAVSLLGLLPAVPPEPVMARVQAWAGHSSEERLLNAMVERGLAAIRSEQAVSYLQAVIAWLGGDDVALQKLGLMSLAPLVSQQGFDNLPAVFHAITPYIRSTPLGLQSYLLDVLQALAVRSPSETAFFLRQNLELPGKPGAAWLIRQLASHFPAEMQTSLRAAVRGR